MATRDSIETRCDAWSAAGEHLRAAVGWRYLRGQGGMLWVITGVPLDVIERFVETGEIDERHWRMLELYQYPFGEP